MTRPIDPTIVRESLSKFGYAPMRPDLEAPTLRQHFRERTAERRQKGQAEDAMQCTDCGEVSDDSAEGGCPFCGARDDEPPTAGPEAA
jgi:hypothetical protein